MPGEIDIDFSAETILCSIKSCLTCSPTTIENVVSFANDLSAKTSRRVKLDRKYPLNKCPW